MTTPYERLTSVLATYDQRLKTHGPEYTGYLAYAQVDDLRAILAEYAAYRAALKPVVTAPAGLPATPADTLTLLDRFTLAAISALIAERAK